MEELKTLNDLSDISVKNGIEYLPSLEILNQEVVKWIKCEDGNATTDVTDAWIKHFFNITEEDLK